MAKILVIRLTSLGDVIFTLPLVNVLKQNGHQVDYMVSERGIGVIKNNPSITNVHFIPLMKWRKEGFKLKEFANIINRVRAEKYDIALDCQQMLKSLLLFRLCGAKRRITFSDAREMSKFGGNEFITPKTHFRDYNYHIVERNLDFARFLGLEANDIKFPLPPSDKTTTAKIENLLSELDKTKKTVVIAPATTWENKYWATENWKIIVNELKKEHNIIFTGTQNDNELIKSISENGINLAGKTNLPELMETFKCADLVISPDSGSSNLAWSCGIPAVITIFTCTPAKRFGPYGNDNKYFSVQGKLSCQPCFKKKCKLKTCKCNNIPTPDEILNIANKILD